MTEEPKEQPKAAKPMNIKEAIAIQQKNINVLVQRTDALLALRNKDQDIMKTLIKVIEQFKNELEAIESVVFINESEPKEEPKEEPKDETDIIDELPDEPIEKPDEVPDANGAEIPKEETVVEEIPNAESEPVEKPAESEPKESGKYPPEA